MWPNPRENIFGLAEAKQKIFSRRFCLKSAILDQEAYMATGLFVLPKNPRHRPGIFVHLPFEHLQTGCCLTL